MRVAVLLVAVLVSATGCDAERGRLMKERYPAYPDTIKRAIDRGHPVRGMNQEQVFLALGEPICKKTIEFQGRSVEVWLFPPGGRDPCTTAEFRVYFEDGVVSGWENFNKPTRFTDPAGGGPP